MVSCQVVERCHRNSDVNETLGYENRDVRFSVRDETETLLGRGRNASRDLLACDTMASFSMLYEFMNSRYRVVKN